MSISTPQIPKISFTNVVFELFRLDDKAAEAYLMQMSTPDLLRMLELLDMLESKEAMKASERELATLQYLLKSYE